MVALTFVLLTLIITSCARSLVQSELNTATVLSEGCSTDDQCTLAIQIDHCCSCPMAYTVDQVNQSDNLIAYSENLSYRELLPNTCTRIDCPQCPPFPVGVVCSEENRCQVLNSADGILARCPSCFLQAAVAAYGETKFEVALDYCARTTGSDLLRCYVDLYEAALKNNDLDNAEYLCTEYFENDLGACMPQLALRWARVNLERALSLCNQIWNEDARFFGCIVDVALIVSEQDSEQAIETCSLLSPEDAALCQSEVDDQR